MVEFIAYPLLLEPYYSERPWGGEALSSVLKKKAPPVGGPYGESWELSDHPDGPSKIANGTYEGRHFGDLAREFPHDMLGVADAPERYPLLVKYIDAAQDLSVQVHPSDATAPRGDRGKTECWYIMRADPGAVMVWGLRSGVDAALLCAATDAGGAAVEQCIQRVPIAAGDFIYIPAGTVHATMAGTLLCEVQQSSNTTWRIYDWDRKPARELHIDEACRVANFEPSAQKPLVIKTSALTPAEWHQLVSNQFFTVKLATWIESTGKDLHLPNLHGLILSIVEGSGSLFYGPHRFTITIGQTWFLPAGLEHLSLNIVEQPLRLLLIEARELFVTTERSN